MAAAPTPVAQDATATTQQLQQAAATDRATAQASQTWQSNRDDANVKGPR